MVSLAAPLQFPGQSNRLLLPDVGSCSNLSVTAVNECEMQELSTIDVVPPNGDCPIFTAWIFSMKMIYSYHCDDLWLDTPTHPHTHTHNSIPAVTLALTDHM